jgi:hypothetical protein
LHIKNSTYLTTGDEIALTRAFDVAALRSHIILQDGKIIEDGDLSPYRISCIFDVYDLGPATYQPQIFNVTDVTYNEEMYSDLGAVVRYFTEFYLSSNHSQKKKTLTCQVLDDTTQYHPFAISEIKQATGDYFIF